MVHIAICCHVSKCRLHVNCVDSLQPTLCMNTDVLGTAKLMHKILNKCVHTLPVNFIAPQQRSPLLRTLRRTFTNMLDANSLFALPVTYLFHLLSEWVPPKALGRLDSATVGSTSRADLLQLLCAPGHVFHQQPCEDTHNIDHYIAQYMQWVGVRRVKVSSLLFPKNCKGITKAHVAAFFRATGRYLKKITTTKNKDYEVNRIYPCIEAECTALEVFVSRHSPAAVALIGVLSACQSTIQQLELSGCAYRDDIGDTSLYCPHLHTLTLHEGYSFPPQLLTAVVNSYPNFITFSCEQMSGTSGRHPLGSLSDGLPFIAGMTQQYEHLRELDVSDASISDIGLTKLSQRCPNLTTFVANGAEFTDVGMAAVTKHCRFLHTIVIHQSFWLKDASLIAIADNCGATLTPLDASLCHEITSVSICAIAEQCQRLKYLNLEKAIGLTFADANCNGLNGLKHCTALEELIVDKLWVYDDLLCTLAVQCPALRCLSIHRTKGYTADGMFAFLKQATQLRELVVCKTSTVVTRLSVLFIEQHYPNLKVIGAADNDYEPCLEDADLGDY